MVKHHEAHAQLSLRALRDSLHEYHPNALDRSPCHLGHAGWISRSRVYHASNAGILQYVLSQMLPFISQFTAASQPMRFWILLNRARRSWQRTSLALLSGNVWRSVWCALLFRFAVGLFANMRRRKRRAVLRRIDILLQELLGTYLCRVMYPLIYRRAFAAAYRESLSRLSSTRALNWPSHFARRALGVSNST